MYIKTNESSKNTERYKINNVIDNFPKAHLHHQTSLDAFNDGSYYIFIIYSRDLQNTL